MQSRQGYFRRYSPTSEREKDKFRINENIKARTVRLIDETGQSLGVLSSNDALELASKKGLDLVEILPQDNPPVCKIFNYNKFIYQREKKRKEAKKHNKAKQLKEIKFRPQTDVHDYNFKVKHIKEFLEHGDKVKVTIRFKGRELAFKHLGYDKIEKIIADIKDLGKVESPAKMEGRTLFMTVSPLRAVGGGRMTKDSPPLPSPTSSKNETTTTTKAKTDAPAPTNVSSTGSIGAILEAKETEITQ